MFKTTPAETPAEYIGMLEEPLEPGDYVLIHVGFAMNKIDPSEARKALEGLQMMGNNDTEVDQWV